MSIRALVALVVIASPAWAQTSYPMITHATPVAVQRGQTAEVMVEGQMSFVGVYKAIFEGTGIQAEVLPGPETKPGQQVRAVKLRLTAAADTALGVREFRLASKLGIS